jgi:hypothetical protein
MTKKLPATYTTSSGFIISYLYLLWLHNVGILYVKNKRICSLLGTKYVLKYYAHLRQFLGLEGLPTSIVSIIIIIIIAILLSYLAQGRTGEPLCADVKFGTRRNINSDCVLLLPILTYGDTWQFGNSQTRNCFSVIHRTIFTLSSKPHHREVLLPREDNQRERITLHLGRRLFWSVKLWKSHERN